jgi:hypothetical protein
MKAIIIRSIALCASACLGVEAAADKSSGEDATSPVAVEEAARHTAEVAQQINDRVVEHAQRAVELAQSRMARAQAGDAEEDTDLQAVFDGGGGAFAFTAGGRGSAQPLVVRTTDTDPNTVSKIQEDLNVMSRIVTKTVEREAGREGHDSAMGIVLSALPASRRPQSLYLEGYGALFMIPVKFPLVAPSSKEEEKAEKTVDSTWEQTRRELYGQKGGPVRVWELPAREQAPAYDAEQVENLKKELLESLKNGTNIRDLKPEESITIAVIGTASGGLGVKMKQPNSRSSGTVRKSEIFAIAGPRGAGRESTLTMRVKKADVDAFAKGTIDFEQFKKRAAVFAY